MRASGASNKANKPASARSREGRSRKADSYGLQLCKVCETRKPPQQFYNRHKTCKNCQCQINRIARSQHCSRDEAKRQVNASAHEERGTVPAPASFDDTANDTAGLFQTGPRLGSCNLGTGMQGGTGSISSSGQAGSTASPRKRSADNFAATSTDAAVAAQRREEYMRRSSSPAPMAPGADHASGPLIENRASHTGFKCDLNHLADIASAMLEADYEDAPCKARRIMCASNLRHRCS